MKKKIIRNCLFCNKRLDCDKLYRSKTLRQYKFSCNQHEHDQFHFTISNSEISNLIIYKMYPYLSVIFYPDSIFIMGKEDKSYMKYILPKDTISSIIDKLSYPLDAEALKNKIKLYVLMI